MALLRVEFSDRLAYACATCVSKSLTITANSDRITASQGSIDLVCVCQREGGERGRLTYREAEKKGRQTKRKKKDRASEREKRYLL